MDLTIINKPANFWDTKLDVAFPALLRYGGQIYKANSDPSDRSLWIYVIANADGTFKDPIIAGYSTSEYDKHTPNVGFWNTGNTLLQPSGDLGLFTLSKTYLSLDFQYGANEDTPLEFGYADLKAIDVVGDSISATDSVINNEGDVIKNWVNDNLTYQLESEIEYEL